MTRLGSRTPEKGVVIGTLTGDTAPPPAHRAQSTIVIMTSGTTGTPKGAARSEPYSLMPVGGLLDKVPFRARHVIECCVPLFHALGFSRAMLLDGDTGLPER
ncbi:MAG: AMP-binding protein [Mycobacterium sp.]|uniref:AMP-binding protein n=1 Tax=Mycobacterium sp. TaxID=1785 RepID=UPI0026259300|nr:AMP-binding protein [Mycobacterium sp.]MDI3315302.1 AMP-binding protein [Mycobacterium sp.]